jgi:carotenoid cleavage dioxygenase-like enzyme
VRAAAPDDLRDELVAAGRAGLEDELDGWLLRMGAG